MVYENDLSSLLRSGTILFTEAFKRPSRSKEYSFLLYDSCYHYICASVKQVGIPENNSFVKIAEKLYSSGKIKKAYATMILLQAQIEQDTGSVLYS